jgi:hypothetical protein
MAQIKKEILALSEWLSIELLSNSVIDPPVLKLRLKPINRLESVDFMERTEDRVKYGSYIIGAAMEAVHDWDLAGLDGKPLPLDETNRNSYLKVLLGEQTADGILLGYVIYEFASNVGNFLKN